MSSINQTPHIKRWVKASVIKLFQTLNEGIELYVEGMDAVNVSRKDKHFELRIDGPYTKPLTKGSYRHYFEINILINSTRSEEDFYERENLQGIVANILNRDICVYRIGNKDTNPADDGSLVGALQLIPSEQIKVSDFGRINETTEVYQAVGEAHYEMYLTDPE